MADFYDTLSASDQAAFRTALIGKVSQSACPTVDMSGITTADNLTDAGNRGMAVDCYQTAQNLVSGVAGVLDEGTYKSIMGISGGTPSGNTPGALQQATTIPTWLIVAGVAVVGIGIFAAMQMGKRGRR